MTGPLIPPAAPLDDDDAAGPGGDPGAMPGDAVQADEPDGRPVETTGDGTAGAP